MTQNAARIQLHVLTQMLGLLICTSTQTHTHTHTHTVWSSERVKSWEGELTMACMFNRNLFICVSGRKNKRRRKEKKNMKMDGVVVMQMKDTTT